MRDTATYSHPLEVRLQTIRDFLVPLWVEWGELRGKVVTDKGEGMCRFTAAFLAQALGDGWKFTGGHPDMLDTHALRWVDRPDGGGFKSAQGQWHGHHWVYKDDLIVDLAAAQFDESDVIITSIEDSRYRATLDKQEVQEALRDVKKRTGDWLLLWRANAVSRELAETSRSAQPNNPSQHP